MFEKIGELFATNGFMPHGHCYLWQPGMVWLQVISNGMIGLSYVAISSTLAYLVYRIRNIPFQWMYMCFGLFIVTCGITHFVEIWTIWKPVYWLDGTLRAVTAIASAGTAIILPPLIPKAIALAQGAKAAQDRGIRLETAYQQLGEVFEKTKELDELKTQFFANVSHELRTPLALILGPVEKLQGAENLRADQRQDLEVVRRNAAVLLKHVNDLLDIAKLEAGKMKPSYVAADLAVLIRRMTGNFDGLAREREIALTVDAPPALPIEVDVDMIERVLLNLLSNAFKFTPSGGRIEIRLEIRDAFARVSVADSGPGVPETSRNTIFERFRQVEGGVNRSHGGTGLGLSIVKEFLELHRGDIQVDQAPWEGGGALFQFEIPLRAPEGAKVLASAVREHHEEAARQALADLTESTHRLEALTSQTTGNKGLVLVVEDNPDMNHFIAEILAGDYRVETAFNGQEGLIKAAELCPDLIVSDIMMPVMSGDRMVAAVRRQPHLRGTPILLLTAKADDELRNQLLRDGVQDYVTKPFSAEELCARVKNLVTVKRATDLLQQELSSQLRDLEMLAQEVTRQRKDLQRTLSDLRVAKEDAERASHAKSVFLGLVSHEMKTPMTSVRLQLDVLKRLEGKTLSPRQKEVLQRLDRSSERSIELMESLLEYTKLQTGRIETKAETIDLPRLLHETIESLRSDVEEKSLKIKMDPWDAALPPLESDRLLVQRIAKNLIANAIKYTETGEVEVAVSYRDGRHYMAVKDTGPGIAREQQAKIFQPFAQLTPLQNKSKPGFGLGLSIAHESIKVLGGDIAVVSDLGKGSTFIADLPPLLSLQHGRDL
jgi:signal transduction histidine kinase